VARDFAGRGVVDRLEPVARSLRGDAADPVADVAGGDEGFWCT